jgi:topoisomerase IA-like protein
MATIEDLPNKSISDMSTDEAIELLRQIRLSRRTMKASTARKKASTAKVKKATEKATKLTPEQAKKLLEMLGG